ncbi:MAG: hypothetical protein ACLGXA_12745 [Acidobacteriota bacterium]
MASRLAAGIACAGILGGSLLLARATAFAEATSADTDRDGLSDALEQKLLLQFLPTFMMAPHDCAGLPAAFRPGAPEPEVEAEDGTIYGQAFPAQSADGKSPTMELHYYDLWQKDCGPHGHPLDTEHVAVLVIPSGPDPSTAPWKALYWYAAAHENTVCDVSQIGRASALDAEDHGATVWISPGKHASYLDSSLCHQGCGADRCDRMTALVPAQLINLGEPGSPMHGAVFIASKAWPLGDKMSTSNFPAEALARVNALPDGEMARFHPGRHPVQGIIASSSTTEQGLATGAAHTTAAMSDASSSAEEALSVGNDSTNAALASATGDTGNAFRKGYRHTRHALGASIRNVGKALHLSGAKDQKKPQ